MRRDVALKIREMIEKSVASLTDVEALDVPMLFPQFIPSGKAYITGNRFYYQDKLYKVLQGHTSQPSWLPTTANSLYVEVTPPGVIAAWKQPLGAHDSYAIGVKVTHNNKTWINTSANNSFAPGVFWVV